MNCSICGAKIEARENAILLPLLHQLICRELLCSVAGQALIQVHAKKVESEVSNG